MRGDADTAPLIQAAINADYSRAAFNEETRRVQSVSNQAEAAAIKVAQDFSNRLAADLDEGLAAAFAEIDAFDDSFADLELDIPEIDTSNLDKALEEIQTKAEKYREKLAIVEQSASMFKDALQSAMGDGLQSITDMMFGLDDEERQWLIDETPLSRFGSGEDIARSVYFLATDSFITGQNLSPNGGFVIN